MTATTLPRGDSSTEPAPPPVHRPARPPATEGRRPAATPGPRPRPRRRRAVAQRHRAAAAGRPHRRAPSTTGSRASGRPSPRPSPSPRSGSPSSSRRSSPSSTPSWAPSSPGSSSATTSRASGSSTRSSTCRSRCRPSSRASCCSRSTARTARSASTSTRPGWALVVALAFVTLPFVVRSVQPVLIELDREVEEAAASLGASNRTTFRRIVLPTLAPAIIGGTGLAFARAVGEYGSVVLIGGNIPRETQVVSQYIQQQIEIDRPVNAAAVSVALLAVSFLTLFVLRIWSGREPAQGGEVAREDVARAPPSRCARSRCVYLVGLLAVPIAVILWRTFEPGVGAVRRVGPDACGHLGPQPLACSSSRSSCRSTSSSASSRPSPSPAGRCRSAGSSRPSSTCRSRCRPIVVGVSLIMLWGVTRLVRRARGRRPASR